jgi:hypothetical protein
MVARILGGQARQITVHGGADPQTTADYVLKGQLGVWDAPTTPDMESMQNV